MRRVAGTASEADPGVQNDLPGTGRPVIGQVVRVVPVGRPDRPDLTGNGSTLLRRRAVLALGALTAAGAGLSACTPSDDADPAGGATSGGERGSDARSEAETQAVARAATAIRVLYDATTSLLDPANPAAGTPKAATTRLLTLLTAVHADQLAALGSPVTGATTTATTTAGTTGTPGDAAGRAVPATRSALAGAEWALARIALRDGEALSPEFAVLLCRIAAACAAGADLLSASTGGPALGPLTPADPATTSGEPPVATPGTSSPSGPSGGSGPDDPLTPSAHGVPATPPTDPPTAPATPGPSSLTRTETDALNRLLAGEHAAVFAYPLVIAHTKGTRRTVATAAWQVHHEQRDALERLLLGAGEDPVGAGAAYQVATPADATAAAALAAKIERKLAGLSLDVVAAGGDRLVVADGADWLVACTRRQAAWSNKPVALPGS